MSPIAILLLVLFILIALVLAEVPVSLALMTSGTVGLVFLRTGKYAFQTLSSAPYTATAAFTLTLIPMFVIMGMLVVQAKIANDVYAFAARTFGKSPAGLGYATVAACAGFAAVTGSSAATVATIGRVSINEMRTHGYSASFAAGIVGAAGTLGILIPPSVVLVIYGTLSGESVGKMLLAGLIPGIISALLYMVVVRWRAKTQVGDEFRLEVPVDPEVENALAGSRTGAAAVAKVLTLFLIVVGGIYSGVFTSTESGAVGAFTALLILIVSAIRDRRIRFFSAIRQAIGDATAVSSMIFLLLIGGGMFTVFMALGGYARQFTEWIIGLSVPGAVILVLFLLMMIPLGMVLDGLSIMLITVPLMHPVVTGLGYDGVWFAILVVKMIEIGLITPPVGINVYVVAGSAPGVKVEDVFRGIWPFGLMDLLTVGILFAFPILVTWLPSVVS